MKKSNEISIKNGSVLSKIVKYYDSKKADTKMNCWFFEKYLLSQKRKSVPKFIGLNSSATASEEESGI